MPRQKVKFRKIAKERERKSRAQHENKRSVHVTSAGKLIKNNEIIEKQQLLWTRRKKELKDQENKLSNWHLYPLNRNLTDNRL